MRVIGLQNLSQAHVNRASILTPDFIRTVYVRECTAEGRVMRVLPRGRYWDNVFKGVAALICDENQKGNTITLQELVRSLLDRFPIDSCRRIWNRDYPPPNLLRGGAAIQGWKAWKEARRDNQESTIIASVKTGVEVTQRLRKLGVDTTRIRELVVAYGDMIGAWALCLVPDVVEWAYNHAGDYMAQDIIKSHTRISDDARLSAGVEAITVQL